jgi:predicted DCC family thiol-disulfide oxidoreductase YuxK
MGSPGSLEDQKPVVVLFDGICNLCNGFVKFIIKRDPSGKIKFASLQSDFGRSQLVRMKMDPGLLYSLIVIDGGKTLERSDAVLHVARHLGIPWKLLTVFHFVPKFLRDGIYNMVARSRYRIFGKRESCMIPTPELRKRFLDTPSNSN